MMIGYVLVGSLAGLFASVVALVLGASFWLAFGLYALVGSTTIILLAAARMVAGVLAGRTESQAAAQYQTELADGRSSESSSGRQGADIEAHMKILAVDDDPFILELLPMISAKAGFSEVVPVASGEQALKMLIRSDTVFDCLLLDISMPGMNGIELCRRIRQITQYRHTPIIMLSAMRDSAHMGDAYRAGATDYATKPFDIEELGSRLRSARQAIHTLRETSLAVREGTGYIRNAVSNYVFEPLDGVLLEGVGSLVDHTVLSNYLTHLPRKEMAGVHVFAVSIDGIETVHRLSSPQQFATLLKDVVTASVDCFGTDRTVMAYTSNAILLIAVNSADALSTIEIERRLLESFSGHDADAGAGIGMSVGGPVQPQGAKAERARMATDRVIALAEGRALDKQGRSVAGLSKR